MSSQPIDYGTLAAQNGAVASSPPPAPISAAPSTAPNGAVPDYDAIAAQNGAVMSSGAEDSDATSASGEQVNDVGNRVIVPKPGESFSDTMKRAAAQGKKTTQEQINKELATVPEKASEVAAATALPLLPEAISSLGGAISGTVADSLPALTKAATQVGQWAKANPITAMGVMWALNKGLNALGLPRASRLVEEMELPALILLGRGGAGEAAAGSDAAAEAASTESAGAAESAATSAAAKSVPESVPVSDQGTSAADYVKQNARATVTPNAAGEATDTATGETLSSNDAEDFLSKENRQAAVDKYYAEHPEKRPQPQIAKRGPNKGQPRTYRVFDNGKWTRVPVMK